MARVVGLLVGLFFLAACGGAASVESGSAITVVAGENFWGSIASQLGGSKVTVQSVVTDPNADPHEYESSPSDARAFAEARLVILNGAGYDSWGQKLLDASRSATRRVLNIADMLGKRQGDNPHFWYEPSFVTQVADRVTSEYRSIDPADATYFDAQRTQLNERFKPYTDEMANINATYSNAPIGATESIFQYMATALGLNLTTPIEFMDAVAEGNDPPAGAVATFQAQIAGNQIRALVYNVQTSTAVTTNVKALAASHHIPSVGVSETLQPENLSFQEWQLRQLRDLEAALKASS